MKAVTYIQEAIRPGGTPKRYLIWVSVVLMAQVLASVLPSSQFYSSFNSSHALLIGVSLCIIVANLFHTEIYKILAAYALYIVGLIVSTVTISLGITSLSGIIFMLTWAMTLFVAERREYISFDLVTLFMVLMLLSTVILLLFEPRLHTPNNHIILITGAVLTATNIYLVYIDFGYEKNFYQESRKTIKNLEQLSSKLSEILSRDESLEVLMWQVTQECVPFLDLEECVIYLYNEDKKRLVQIAAYGGKSTASNEIINPLEIEPGRGIVGRCYESGLEIRVDETRNDPNYLVDDAFRNSELAVPIFSHGKVIGVIDSEHHQKGFFKERHSQVFHIIASFCGVKIAEFKAKESMRKAIIVQEEAARVKELDELKNKFITNISHDLKTPLSLIKAPAMQIAKIAEDARVKKHSQYILKNTEHLLRVVNQLLQLNRVDKGLNELYMEEVEVSELIQKIATQYRGLVERDQIDFSISVEKVKLKTDAFRLEQIIHNLVHNAFRYTGTKGRVELSAKLEASRLIVKVTDNGPGIPLEMRAKVFDRFVKVDVNNHEGTGIGLSLVKEYATSLGGEAHLESEVGRGTTFFVSLPVREANVEPDMNQEWSKEELDASGKPIMLVVEDHADLNAFVCATFEEEFQCFSAFDGEEALKLMRKNTPDIIVSDLMMPKMNGQQFIQYIREEEAWSHLPIIVLSAKGQVESRVEMYEIGADNYLVKPFDIEELSAVVHATLEQRRRLRQLFQHTYLGDAYALLSESDGTEKNDLVSRTIAYVLAHLDTPDLNVTNLGKAMGVGRNKLQREIKEATSLTPVEFLRSIRLNEAKKMLTDPTKQISEVAYMVGFNNLSYFSRAFKCEFGVLPTEWQVAPRC